MKVFRRKANLALLGRSGFGHALVCVVFATALNACSPQASEQELLERARVALGRGEAKAAVIDLKTALQQDPSSGAARRLLGEAYLYQQDPATASDEFARSLKSVEDTEVRVSYARALLSAGRVEKILELNAEDDFVSVAENPQYLAALAQAMSLGAAADRATIQQAQEMMDRAVLAAPEDAYVTTAHGFFLLRYVGAVEEAEHALENTVALHPDYAPAWGLLGDIQQIRGKYARAQSSYGRAVELNPFRFQDRLNLVAMEIERGETKVAGEELDRLDVHHSNHPGVNFLRGRMLLDAGNYTEAVARFSAVLAVSPSHGGALYLAAIANIHEGNHGTAMAQLNSFLVGQPAHLNARLLLGNVYLQLQQPESSERIARKILENNAGNSSALGLLATALNAQGLHGKSAEIYQSMSNAQPEAVEIRLALGTELLLAGKDAAGIAELEAVRDLAPDRATARERLIEAHLKAGNVPAAKREAEAYGAQDSASPRPSIYLGRIALEGNDPVLARKYFQRALLLDPGNVTTNGGLAVLAAADKDMDQARAHYLDALAHHPEDLGTLMNLAAIEGLMGDPEAMVANLEVALKAAPRALAPRLALARSHLVQGRSGEALALLVEVRDFYPREPQLWLLLTEAMLAGGDLVSSAAAAETLLNLSPRDVIALAAVARLELRRGRFTEAEGHLTTALVLQPTNSDLRKLMAEVLVSQGKMEMAGDMLASLPADVAAEPVVRLARGRIALAQNRPVEAEGHLRSAMAAKPTAMTLVWLSGAIVAQGKHLEALQLARDWLVDHPSDGLVHSQLASTYLELGRDKEARAHYLKALDDAPDNVMILNNLSWLYRKDDHKRALGYIEKANRLAPESAQVKDTYAMIQLQRGNLLEALSLNQKALDGMSGNPEILYHRALILHTDGQDEKAMRILEELAAGAAEFTQSTEPRNLLVKLQGL